MNGHSRREFLADVGRGMLVAGLGSAAAEELGISTALAADSSERLTFGALEPLVTLLQETPPERVLPLVVERLRGGESLERLVSAAALANARAFGGHDYTGYHTFMALLPAYQMAGELPSERRALPVLKVLYRNSQRIHGQGAHDHDALPPLPETTAPIDREGISLRQAIRRLDQAGAEAQLAALCRESPAEAFAALQPAVQDEANVHRVVLAWRAWATLDLVGPEYAHTLLRQSVRFCVDSEKYYRDRNRSPSEVRERAPQLLAEYRLLERPLGTRPAEDGWVEHLARTIYAGSSAEAAEAAAAALAEGFDPEAVGEAISLAANLLVLNDPGRSPEHSSPEKPPGCVHGDSVGVHASDAANAWRNIARVSEPRQRAASLVVGAYHTGGQSSRAREGQFPYTHLIPEIKVAEAGGLLRAAREAIETGQQAQAAAVAQRYLELGHPERPLLDLLLRYTVSEDGALHAEKFYRTVVEELATTRPAFRWRHLVALARVTASAHGFPAPGYQSACELLGVA